MKNNKSKILILILFAVTTTARAQSSSIYAPPKVENIALNATQISGRISKILFSPSKEIMILQTDCGFFVLPAMLSGEALADLEKSERHDGEVKGFLPSGKILYSTSRGLFTLDPATGERRPIFQMTGAEAQTAEDFYNRATFVVSENLIVAEDGSYQKDLLKGNILRYDAATQTVTRGAPIYAFNEGKMSPGGRYIFYQHLEVPNRFGNLYDVKRDVNYSISNRFNFKRHFPDLKIFNTEPLLWVAPDKFLVRIDGYKKDDYNLTPMWFVLLDAAGKIIWKQEHESDGEVYPQFFNPTKALLEKSGQLYELSLFNGKLKEIPDLDGAKFRISPDKKKLAFSKDNRIFISTVNGKSKKAVLDLPEDWRTALQYGWSGGQINWAPDSNRLIVFDGRRILIVRL